jgi:hypothetical protein
VHTTGRKTLTSAEAFGECGAQIIYTHHGTECCYSMYHEVKYTYVVCRMDVSTAVSDRSISFAWNMLPTN